MRALPDSGAYIDLHTHSTASDGILPPARLVREAARIGLRALALTDHDTVSGLPEAADEAAKAGIRFIPGIEIEVDRACIADFAPRGEFHLLALGLNRMSEGFTREIERLAEKRRERNRRIVERMRDSGWDASYEEVCHIAGHESAGRPHFAEYLKRLNVVRTTDQAFDLYLGAGKSLYIPKEGANLSSMLTHIRESGAISILAHPSSLYVSWGRLPGLLARLAEAGLDGIEAWHPMATPRACRRLEALARSLGLCVSAGSDYHGGIRRDRQLGRTAGGEKIPLALLEGLPGFAGTDSAAAVPL